MNVVPSASTVRVVQNMLLAARKSNGADAAMLHTYDVHPDQFPALVGVLLKAVLAAEGDRVVTLTTSPTTVCAECAITVSFTQRLRLGLCPGCYRRARVYTRGGAA
jgi:uncharacterized protein (DUF169 family)